MEGNHFSSEALPGALPDGQNNPRVRGDLRIWMGVGFVGNNNDIFCAVLLGVSRYVPMGCMRSKYLEQHSQCLEGETIVANLVLC